jgi:hypothetical protein
MIHDGRELVVTEDRLCLNCGHRGHMSEWEKNYVEQPFSINQANQCPNCGCCGSEVVVLDEPGVEEKRVLNG